MKRILAVLLLACMSLSAYAANVTVSAPVTDVTVYSTGYGFVTRTGTASYAAGSTIHIANFTRSALFSSIAPRLSGASVSGITYYSLLKNETTNETEYYSLDRLLNASIGKTVSFSVGGKAVSGALVWYSYSMLAIAGQNGTSFYRIDALEQLSLPVSNVSGLKLKEIEDRGLAIETSGSGSGPLSVSYLVGGMGWEASYDYYLTTEGTHGTGTLQGWAGVSNNAGEDWNSVDLNVVVGSPHFAMPLYNYVNYKYRNFAESDASAGGSYAAAPSVSQQFTTSQVSAYYVYSLSGVTLNDGESKRLPLLEQQAAYEREFFWQTYNSNPEKVFIFNNTGSESWAPGVFSVYLNGAYLGQQEKGYTPKGSGVRVTVADVSDIATKKETIDSTATSSGNDRVTTYTMRLTLNNSMGEAATVRINDQMYSGDSVELVSSSLPVARLPDNVLEWDATVPAGGAVAIDYVYAVTNYMNVRPY